MNNIRNFVIMAHIDHGKSTLADRFLDITKTIDPRKMQPQFLDRMSIERERGITIKMQPVRMEWDGYILNLIDTPGHVDFSYEVSRSLAAVEGAILLVDATQGVQAQTLTNLEFARKENLTIIPAVNKIDLATADVEKTVAEIEKLLDVKREDIILVSGKTGENVEKLLRVVIEKVPAPKFNSGEKNDIPRALIFDSEYDTYKGVVAYVRVFNGNFKQQDRIYLMQVGANAEVLELGYFKPDFMESKELRAGEIGYIATGLKEIERCRVGDTVTLKNDNFKTEIEPLKGYKEPQPVVFASFYPIDSDDYDLLNDGLRKLKLSDSSLSFNPESSGALGRGFRCGFLGMLHLEIVTERLKRDYGLNLITTSPSVIYRKNAEDKIEEPVMDMEIITPNQYLGPINKLLTNFPGEFKDTVWLTDEKIIIKFEGPLDIILQSFYDKLKTVSSGYASMSYQIKDYKVADLVKLDILIDGEKIEAFSKMVRRDDAYREGKRLVELLKDVLPYYQWSVPIQAAVDGNILARETKKAMKKDVTGYLYGGDYSRKRKLLEKQKKGKKKMAQFGKVNIPADVFLKVLKQR